MYRKLSPELQRKAKLEINEVPNKIADDLEHIKQWLQKQPHLNVRTDDQWLLTFLRSSKFSLERTKKKLDNYSTIKTLCPEYYDNRDPLAPEIQELLSIGGVLPLPKTQDGIGPRIIRFGCPQTQPDKHHIQTFMKLLLMNLDILMMEDDNCAVSGVIVWIELDNCPTNFMLQVTPTIMKKGVIAFEQGYPLRVRKCLTTNCSTAFESIYKLLTVFFSEKIRKRMILYSKSNFVQFYKEIPKSLLPQDYGGEYKAVAEIAGAWKEKVESYRSWFLEDVKYKSNEKLRLGPARSSESVFGVEGSFRKLIID